MGSRKTLEKTENALLPLIQYEGADRGHGAAASFLLWTLARISAVYAAVVQLRLFLYRTGILRRYPLGCQVISIGNVTVGGTGKTPMVEKLARELAAQGRKVAILSRGYRKKEKGFGARLADKFRFGPGGAPPRVVSDGRRLLLDSEMSGDEPYMLATNLPDVVVLVDKDRVKSGRMAVRKFGCDTLLLDDGFQYQKLLHRRDIVLVDRTNPFGNGRVLPRGILREPAGNIKRASFVCITKARGGDTSALRERIRKLNPTAGIMECNHDPTCLVGAFTRERFPLSKLRGMKIVALSGIAAPRSFEASLEALGATILERRHFADHHRFSQQEIIDSVNNAQELGADAIITTEKDAVRMTRIDRCAVPVLFLRIEVTFLDGADEFRRCVEEITFKPA
ncbi:MAG: tetraacyldisaccharide 4'-kinase [Kiritimatiellae bacterium]|nr:tetraacyldisaccharide 4'-kinase [Kiritimatiellia bacterium]MBR1836814.1 tetraacyldisaccharide 4'-kinase [Kiritimatiellia bacterium]